jgi:hypothetical protein
VFGGKTTSSKVIVVAGLGNPVELAMIMSARIGHVQKAQETRMAMATFVARAIVEFRFIFLSFLFIAGLQLAFTALTRPLGMRTITILGVLGRLA